MGRGSRVVGLARLPEKARVYRACMYGEGARLVAGNALLEENALPRREQEKGKMDEENMKNSDY